MAVYIRRWWPSKYQLDAVVEVIVDEYSYDDLITKVCFAYVDQLCDLLLCCVVQAVKFADDVVCLSC